MLFGLWLGFLGSSCDCYRVVVVLRWSLRQWILVMCFPRPPLPWYPRIGRIPFSSQWNRDFNPLRCDICVSFVFVRPMRCLVSELPFWFFLLWS